MLEHPIWAALTTDHRDFALVHGHARRYPPELARFAAVEHPGALEDLHALVEPGDGVGLFLTERYEVPDSWTVFRDRTIEQMVCETPPSDEPSIELVPLGVEDAPEMLALARATEPGPFKEETVRLGRYLGVRDDDGRLVAMAGERLRLPGYTEISGVCTDPDHRGRGYARALMLALMAAEFAEGQVPFLHVKNENGAKVLYEQLGFRVSRAIRLLALSPA